jgi:hypothetical protein
VLDRDVPRAEEGSPREAPSSANNTRTRETVPDLEPPRAAEPYEGLSDPMMGGAAFIARDPDPVPVEVRLPPIEVFRMIVAASRARGIPLLDEAADERAAAGIDNRLMAFRLGGWRVDLLKESDHVSLAERPVPMERAGHEVNILDPMDSVKRKRMRNSPRDGVDIEFLLENHGPDSKSG